MKRVAFVGLSTPIFYDYEFQASKTTSDTMSSPNPILESPFGVLLLFDEVWFVCRSLCPENMRALPYVKFLDEEKDLSFFSQIDIPKWDELIRADPNLKSKFQSFEKSFLSYEEIVKRAGIHWDARPDNHTHSLEIAGKTFQGNSFSLQNLLFDMEIVKCIGRKNVELITNSCTQAWLGDSADSFMRLRLSESLIIEDIPNYLGPEGPYHPCIEEARESKYLTAFRNWIAERPSVSHEKEILEVKNEVEAAIKVAQDEIFLKHLNPRNQYESIGKTLLGTAIDVVIPGFSLIEAIGNEVETFIDNGNRRWMGFIVESRRLKEHKN